MDRATLESALKKKGFVMDDSRDHRFYHLHVDGKKAGIWTKISTGSKYKSLGPPLQANIKKQMKLDTPADLKAFAECPMSHEDYLDKLRAKQLIP